MEDWEGVQEAMKADINQLKDQMSQILEALKALKSTEETSVVRNEGTPSYPPGFYPGPMRVQNANTQGNMMDPIVYPPHLLQQQGNHDVQAQPFPPYGLPPGYTPPTEDYPGGGQALLTAIQTNTTMPQINTHEPTQMPVHNHESANQLSSTHVAGGNTLGTNTFTGPQVTVQPKSLHLMTGMGSHMKPSSHVAMQGVVTEDIGARDKLDILEERLRAIEGGGSYGFGDAAGLCLVPDVVIPPKFKVPEFEKYRGTTCPKSHLTMYCRKMAAHAFDDKMLIHFFQDSLAGVALNWYMHLEPAHIRSWKDLVDAFLKQYKYNIDMAPDRLQLQSMTKKEAETFKEYAQRWREVAAQVEPPLHNKEMVAMFIDTLQSPFYDHMIGSVSSNFADVVIIGERVEVGLKSGKIALGPSAASSVKKSGFNSGKKKEAEAHATSSVSTWAGYAPVHYGHAHPHPTTQFPYVANAMSAYYPQPHQSGTFFPPQANHLTQPTHSLTPQPNQTWKSNSNSNSNQGPNQNSNQKKSFNQDRKYESFTPIPMTYTELLPNLLRNALVAICPMKPLQPPYPKSYDANAKCDYHGGAIGHSTERCLALKRKVQSLVDSGWLSFKEDKPSVENNPLSGHGGASSNAIGKEDGSQLVRRVSEVKTPMSFVFDKLCKYGMVQCEHGETDMCRLHPKAQHSIEQCEEFKKMLQKMMDMHLVQISCQKEDGEVLMQSKEEKDLGVPKPLVIRFTKNTPPLTSQERQPLVIHTPSSFPYKDDKAVPWRYNVQVMNEGQHEESMNKALNVDTSAISNISGIGGMTRSGRFFTPPELRREMNYRGRGKDVEVMTEEAKKFLSEKAVQNEEDPKKDEGRTRKEISDEEAGEFLKFIQQSEYKVVDQLNRMPARISLLELLMNSTTHRKLLMKILSEAHVEQDISLDKFGGIVGNITANNYLTFTDDEIPAEGRGHNKALHISVKCLDHFIARVLIDNGSSLNVMPKSTLEKLPCDGAHMRPSAMVVRAFDGSRREVVGEIELPIQIGPCVFQIVFQVMDITPAYSCLLGRPWIHSAGVVPSTLHQKLKFVMGDKMIIVSGEEDLIVSGPSSTRYIDVTEEALETSFQALEIVSTAYVESVPIEPHLSCASLMMAKIMLKDGYKHGCGLGKNCEGSASFLEIPENKGRYGLGYKPNKEDKRRIMEEKRENNLARLERREPRAGRIPICDIKQSFRSAGWVNTGQVAATEEDFDEESPSWVHPCSPYVELNNWETIELPMVFNYNTM